MATKMYRQGDVLLKPADLPTTAQKLNHTVVATGEATGHNHSFAPGTATLFADAGQLYVVCTEPAVLTHQEHAAISIAPGVYEVVRQREYTPQAVRRVMD